MSKGQAVQFCNILLHPRLYPFGALSPGWSRNKFSFDAGARGRYDESVSGRLDGRGPVLWAEESPHSIEHGAGETSGRSNLPDRATENR
jgi:hypothetical protein